MTPDQLFGEFEAGFPGRKFSAGLLVAMIDLLCELGVPGKNLESYEDLVRTFPQQSATPAGKRYNTLVVLKPDGKTLSLRPSYNNAERYFRAEHKLLSAGPHRVMSAPGG
jgi:hypothetical protein